MDIKMKILHVVISLAPEWGGPTKVVHELTETLVKRRGVRSQQLTIWFENCSSILYSSI